MQKRTRLILLIVIVVLILLFIFLVWYWGRRPVPVIENLNQLTNMGFIPPINRAANVNVSPVQEPKTEAYLLALARTFTERFGSFSNQSNFENLEELKVLMTPQMVSKINEFIEQQKAQIGDSLVYYGVTTKVLSLEVKKFDEAAGLAEILIITQRQEARGTMDNPSVFYQDILLKLNKIGEEWKINEAVWQ